MNIVITTLIGAPDSSAADFATLSNLVITFSMVSLAVVEAISAADSVVTAPTWAVEKVFYNN